MAKRYAARMTSAVARRPCIHLHHRQVRVVSAWASANGLVLGQVATDAKANEITAIPELLRLLDLKGCIVTIDAAGTQTAIAEQTPARNAGAGCGR